jgi:hypothetical protein
MSMINNMIYYGVTYNPEDTMDSYIRLGVQSQVKSDLVARYARVSAIAYALVWLIIYLLVALIE